jgi:ArsR family transcriptional regulator
MRICAYIVITKGKAMQDLIKATKALSDETRLRILNVLLERECCVCEVMQALDISQSRASRNLGLLQDAGFLKMRRDGLWSLYSMDGDMKDYVSDLVSAARKSLNDNPQAKIDRERLKTTRRTGMVSKSCSAENVPALQGKA